jgi:arsenate reductase
MPKTTTRVLILCTGNSCRSQMAEGFLKLYDPTLDVYSAGTFPAKAVHPKAIQVMNEIGIDISRNTTKSVDQFLSTSFDYLITVCDDAKEACPVFAGRVNNRIHIGFEDPAKVQASEAVILKAFRESRDEIGRKFKALAESIQ